MFEPNTIRQPFDQYSFDQLVLRVAYSIFRWREMVGKIDPSNEVGYRLGDHHIAWLLVSTEYYVPDHPVYQWLPSRSKISVRDFESLARYIAHNISRSRAKFDWLLAEWQLSNEKPGFVIDKSEIRQRASELFEARREFSDLQNWELGKILASENYVIAKSDCA